MQLHSRNILEMQKLIEYHLIYALIGQEYMSSLLHRLQ